MNGNFITETKWLKDINYKKLLSINTDRELASYNKHIKKDL